jgi:hypothetical protein
MLLFGDNNLIDCEPKELKTLFTQSAEHFDFHIKSLVKVNKIETCNNPHFFVLKKKSIIKNVLNENSDMGPFVHELTKYSFKDVNVYIAHYIIQGIKNSVIRRYANIRLQYDEDKNILINFINTNIDLIYEFIKNDNTTILDMCVNEKMKEKIVQIKNFTIIHNFNILKNEDLL